MLVSFSIDYRANWGEDVWLNISEAGGEPRLHKMTCADGEHWSLDLEIPSSTIEIEYFYELRRGEELVTRGWGKRRSLRLDKSFSRYTLRDKWRSVPDDKTLYTSPFTETFFRRDEKPAPKIKCKEAITIKVCAPSVMPHQRLYITGSNKALGTWDLTKAQPMDGSSFPEWSITVNADIANTGDEYKFVIMENRKPVEWERGDNRIWRRSAFEPKEHRVYSGLRFRGGNTHWRGAGTAIPVFSLRSKTSYGIGDFEDLRKLADWAVLTGQKVIQILPINDTTRTETWRDSYPYKSISIFALHPLYLSLQAMGELHDETLAKSIKTEGRKLNKLPQVDYEAVGRLKWRFFKAIYQQEGHKTLASREYKEFQNANKEWLQPYAAFCYLRDKNKTVDFTQWGKEKRYTHKLIQTLINPSFEEYDSVAIYLYLQFHLDRQLRAAAAYCRSKGIALKGDIPIGVSRESVETWSEPRLFNMTGQAGAPPDDFSVMGQNWGFPTYNWEAMAQDGYSWWKRRFRKMADYFDLYRVDHILGFFRIWEIPTDAVQGLLGYFNPALPMSYDELSSWGMPMNRDRYLRPFIHYDYAIGMFGGNPKEMNKYLSDCGNGILSLKDKFNTQAKIRKYFGEQPDESAAAIRDTLYSLVNEVLFIEDPRHEGHFHPRIAAHQTHSYQYLPDWEKSRFNDIYTHFYYHRHNDFWRDRAMEKLPALIDTTDMLCCAEDLGMIPDCVPSVMNDLKIITLEIQRMPKQTYLEFGDTTQYPYLSVCSTSTHDMSTLRGWWTEDRAKTQRYYNNVMHWYGEAPEQATAEICQTIIGNHLMSASLLAILPLQDWLSISDDLRLGNPEEERINIPADPDHYWRYRMHIDIEELIKAKEFNSLISEMIKGSDR